MRFLCEPRRADVRVLLTALIRRWGREFVFREKGSGAEGRVSLWVTPRHAERIRKRELECMLAACDVALLILEPTGEVP